MTASNESIALLLPALEEAYQRQTGKRGSFAYKGSDWFVREGADAELWRADVALLAAEHRLLMEAVASFDAARLDELTPKKKFTYAGVIRGAAAHDLYHAGQIHLLKRLV